MLKRLKIAHFKLIEQATFEPGRGFTVLTGETGAGKSTLMGAFSLLLGDRADASIWKNNEEKCVVEGEFEISGAAYESFFEAEDLDYENPTIIRREIRPSGKSRAFINDTPVTLDVLKNLAIHLVDIHSQHETLSIGQEATQLEVLDVFAEAHPALKSYQDAYQSWRKSQEELKSRQAALAEAQKNQDYNQFLYGELQELPLDELNQKELDEELDQLEHAEHIKELASQVMELANLEEQGTFDQLFTIEHRLQELSPFGQAFEQSLEQFLSARKELEDALQQMELASAHIDLDPERQQELTQISDTLNSLLRKHQCESVEELRELRSKLEKELQDAAFAEEDLEALEKEVENKAKSTETAAKQLRAKREKALLPLADKLQTLLQNLGMPKAEVQIDLQEKAFGPNGADAISIRFTANAGVEPKPIAKAASGGEFSRIMLAVKSILAGKVKLPTLFFDEIDSGVSGQVARQVAALLKELSQNHQVICITHMPQVAGKGDTHYRIRKDHSTERSTTLLEELNEEEHINEIAHMIAGDPISDAARASARELIKE